MGVRSTRLAAWSAAATFVFLTVSVERPAAQVAGGSVSTSGQNQIRETEKRVGATVDFQILNVIDIPSQLDETRPPPNADKKGFELNDVEVEGSSIYSNADFAPILKPYLKQHVSPERSCRNTMTTAMSSSRSPFPASTLPAAT
jgi:hypothetical protein